MLHFMCVQRGPYKISARITHQATLVKKTNEYLKNNSEEGIGMKLRKPSVVLCHIEVHHIFTFTQVDQVELS